MKKLFLFLMFFCAQNVYAQKIKKVEKVSDNSVYIKGGTFEGAIFSGVYIAIYPKESDTRAVDLSVEDVLLAEQLIKNKSDSLANNSQKELVVRNVANYYRQYFGYLNKNNEKIIFINALHKKSPFLEGKKWKKEQIDVLDGGNYYWQIKINLTTKKIFDFWINGVA